MTEPIASDEVRAHLKEGEKVLWIGTTNMPDKVPWAVVFIAFSVLCIWWSGWYAIVPDSAEEACALSRTRRGCELNYYLAWPYLVFSIGMLAGNLKLLMLAMTPISRWPIFLITDQRALSVKPGARQQVKSVVLKGVRLRHHWSHLWFGSAFYPKLKFDWLGKKAMAQAREFAVQGGAVDNGSVR